MSFVESKTKETIAKGKGLFICLTKQQTFRDVTTGFLEN